MTGEIPKAILSSPQVRLSQPTKSAPAAPADAAGRTRVARSKEHEDDDWEDVADVLARNEDDTSDATRLPGAAYQSCLMAEGTRLAEVGYQSRLAAAGERPTPERYAIGSVIGDRYEVLAIHRGTMGTIYGTFDRENKLPRALKTLQHRFAANTKMRDLFRAEATTWVRLEKHPFIVRAHLVELFDGQPYVITEYIRGREGMACDLRGWLGHPRLAMPVAVEMALQIAQAMQHATRKVPGLVHRDLKPANILIDDRGRALVTDFGLAHAAEAGAGTPAYMAPEQWRGEELEERADLYAFGCILHEMLTGRRLYPALTIEDWRAAHLSNVPVPPRGLKPELPVILDDLVRRCLAKEIAARPASWDDVVSVCARVFHEVTGQSAVLDFSAYELTAGELVSASYSLLTLDKPQEAVKACNRALRIDPLCSAAWVNKGSALDNLGRFDEAIDCCNRAIEIDPNESAPWYNKGNALGSVMRHDESLVCYDRAIEIDPNDNAAWHNKGNALRLLQRYDGAVECYDCALNIDPRDTSSWQNKGLALRDLKRNEEAIVCYDRVIETNPRSSSVWNDKGAALNDLQRHGEANACYDRALDIDPGHAIAWQNKGNALSGLRLYDEAVACFEQATQINPRDTDSWVNKGVTFQKLQRHDEAIACYDRALAIDPGGARTAELRAAADAARAAAGASSDEVIAGYDRLLAVDPDDVSIWYNKGVRLEAFKRYAEAFGCYDRAMEIAPSGAWAARLLTVAETARTAALLQRAGSDEVIACYERALRINPGDGDVWYNKGVTLEGLQRYDEALSCYDRALGVDPLNASVWESKADVLNNLQRCDEAFACYDRAREIESCG